MPRLRIAAAARAANPAGDRAPAAGDRRAVAPTADVAPRLRGCRSVRHAAAQTSRRAAPKPTPRPPAGEQRSVRRQPDGRQLQGRLSRGDSQGQARVLQHGVAQAQKIEVNGDRAVFTFAAGQRALREQFDRIARGSNRWRSRPPDGGLR